LEKSEEQNEFTRRVEALSKRGVKVQVSVGNRYIM